MHIDIYLKVHHFIFTSTYLAMCFEINRPYLHIYGLTVADIFYFFRGGGKRALPPLSIIGKGEEKEEKFGGGGWTD